MESIAPVPPAGRRQPVDRLVRLNGTKIPSTTHRHLLAQRLHRLAAPANS